jgi:hypothetical protein
MVSFCVVARLASSFPSPFSFSPSQPSFRTHRSYWPIRLHNRRLHCGIHQDPRLRQSGLDFVPVWHPRGCYDTVSQNTSFFLRSAVFSSTFPCSCAGIGWCPTGVPSLPPSLVPPCPPPLSIARWALFSINHGKGPRRCVVCASSSSSPLSLSPPPPPPPPSPSSLALPWLHSI